MAVDFELFYDWARARFGEQNIKIRNTAHGTELCTHSPWSEKRIGKIDTKYHLWMNPSGGKSKHPEKGSYRCWLTDEKGSLVQLVAEIDNIDYEDAETLICGANTLRLLEQKVHEFFGHKEEMEIVRQVEIPVKKLVELPPSSFLIDKMSSSHYMCVRAKDYLAKRRLSSDGLYVCVAGDYRNRIIIPYYNAEQELIYYNARLMSDKAGALRYMKCPTDVVSQEEVVFMTSWPRAGTKVYVMEGEFDAMSLKLCGFTACACGGKFLSDTQIEMIRHYDLVLAFDADNPGLGALLDIGKSLLEKGFTSIRYVRPPKAYKDWNKFLIERDTETVKMYLNRYEKPFTPDTPALLLSNRL